MKQVNITAFKREKTGKNFAKKLRKQGLIPAIIYGPRDIPMPIAVKFNELERIFARYKGETIIFNIKIQNGETINKSAILKDYQTDPVTDRIIHLDFYAIHEGETLSIDVPLEFVGKPEGVAKGGVLEILRHEITIECTPANIPDKIQIDISSLDIGDTLHIEDIKLPEGVKIAEDPKEPVVTIVAEQTESEATEEETQTESTKET